MLAKLQTFQQPGLYLITALGLVYSAYELLRVAGRGIENLQIEDVLFDWHVLFVFVSAPMLIVVHLSALVIGKKPLKLLFGGL